MTDRQLQVHGGRDRNGQGGALRWTDGFSQTRKNEHTTPLRPMVIAIPPGIWHGFQNLLLSEVSSFIGYSKRAHGCGGPDEWRLPLDTSEVRYTL